MFKLSLIIILPYLRIRIGVIAIVLSLFSAAAQKGSASEPQLQKGELVLPADWSGEARELKGDWGFAWSTFVAPELDHWPEEIAYYDFLTPWDRLPQPTLKDRSQGYASYIIRLRNKGEQRKLALRFPEIHSSYQAFLNGTKISASGHPGKVAEHTKPQGWPTTASVIIKPGDNWLILHVANFNYVSGGPVFPLTLGDAASVLYQEEVLRSTAIFVAGALMIMSIFCLVSFYFQRRDPSFLAFGLFALLFIYRVFGGDIYLVQKLIPELSWAWAFRLEYGSLFLTIPLFAYGYRWLIRPVISIYWFHGLALLAGLMLLSLALPVQVFSELYRYFLVVVTLLVSVIMALHLRYIRWTHTMSWVTGLAISGMILAVLLRVGTFFDLWSDTLMYSMAGYGIFVIAQSVALSQRFGYNLRQEIQRTEQAKISQRHFLNSVSHELRTPMNAILGEAQMLGNTELDESQRKKLDSLHKHSEQLNSLLRDLLNFSALDSGKLKLEVAKFDLRGTLKVLIEDLKERYKGKNCGLETYIDEAIPPQVVGDEERLHLIYFHLLDNALKFTEEGTVALRIQVISEDNSKVQLRSTITDTGNGITKKELDQVMEAFKQGDQGNTRKYGGTGLGLTLSTQMVEKMNGDLWIDSLPGQGTKVTFELELPIPQVNLSPQAESVKQEHQQLNPDLKILYAEDNPVNQKLLAMMLKSMGYEIDIAEDGKRAWEMAQEGEYHIIFMDVQMPRMDGIEATKHIIDDVPTRPIIIAVTANADVADQHRCLEAGMNDFIAKPFNAQSLREGLVKWQGLWQYLETGKDHGTIYQRSS